MCEFYPRCGVRVGVISCRRRNDRWRKKRTRKRSKRTRRVFNRAFLGFDALILVREYRWKVANHRAHWWKPQKAAQCGDRRWPISLSLLSHVSSSNETVRSSSGRKIQMRIVAKDQNSRPSLDELSEFKKSDSDTGSASLQIALLTKRIENLTAHLQANRKDYSTQRGLKLLLGRRGRLQKYLAKEDPAKYQVTMKGLGLKIKSV